MNSAEDFLEGKLLLIDKPLNWTSFQVVNKMRWEIKRKVSLKKIKVGHAGTLDPLATGLLVICTGKMTKQIDNYQAQEKEYTGTITLGSTTPSYDLETEIDQVYPTAHITDDLLHEVAQEFTGEIEQKPPIFSAVKKDGQRLYNIARAGKTTEIPTRTVNISEFKITKFENNIVYFKVVCSKGTYIRSLANDFGKALNSGAHLSSLRRTRIGQLSISDSISLENFISSLENS
ncbi:MAG: tRNA pseudouridine(55) synthase TruB [Flavobacteriaceae bacterium]|nr:tRNA pseudouridine(55) synthase TruB [Flavobacteriaceae bacterium]